MTMPAGEPFTREIQSSDAPEELEYRVVVALTPILAPAKYKLAAQGTEGVEYRRHYLRPELLAGAVVTIVLSVALVGTGHELPVPLGLACAALLSLFLARGTEVLRVTVEPGPGGSTARLSGHLNSRGRMAVRGVEPMSALPLREARRHLHVVDSPTAP
jgi:hypothetical protein